MTIFPGDSSRARGIRVGDEGFVTAGRLLEVLDFLEETVDSADGDAARFDPTDIVEESLFLTGFGAPFGL